MSRLLLVPALAAFAFAAPAGFSTDALAAGSSTPTKIKCRKGKVPNRKGNKCVRKTSEVLTDRDYALAARDLAYEGDYKGALELLDLAENQNDPRILNYRGYATRKMGDIEGGMKFYRAALRIDPSYTLVREYMGEGFLSLGQVDKAEEQLVEIERLCGGTECREYTLLNSAIKTHKLLNPSE